MATRREPAVLALGLILAAIGFVNAAPAFGPLPDFGVIPVTTLHPGVMAFGLVISALLASRAAGGARGLAETGLHAALVAVGLYALWRYHVDVGGIETGGLFFFTEDHAWIAVVACAVISYFCWRLWGAPLAVIGLLALAYFFTGEHWPGILGHAGMDFVQDAPPELWFNTGDGVMGSIMAIVVNTIFPFIILGAMLEGTGGGASMIRISVHLMRRFRGGPAHAAILASSLFGTISGSATANVVGTGVITIPMIKKRGFSAPFAGGVEATASTGGQIVPPIMGAAALVMADFVGISYLTIIVAAIVPAIAYYASLFATVVFEARRLGVRASEDEDIEPVGRQDIVNLILVLVPLATVIVALIRGASPAGSAMLALMVLVVLSFLNPEIRRAPWLILKAFARGGVTFARLLMAVGVVGIVVAVLGSTGLPLEFAKAVSGGAAQGLLATLIFAALASLALGMGMPTLPAYLTIVVILGPSLQALGLSDLTAHFFVFYFGVASAITPPVAIAAYAAATIGGGGAIATAVQATRIGLVIFAIPFLFAFNPIMLIVPEGGAAWDAGAFLFLLVQLAVLVYMLASAAARFDRRRLGWGEAALRLAVGLAVIHPDALVSGAAVAASIALVAVHRAAHGRRKPA